MTIDELKAGLELCGVSTVSSECGPFSERFEPRIDRNEDYRVVYEAVVEFAALDQARIEFWLTDEGYLAVGIETRSRISRRLDLWPLGSGFVAGHEPKQVSRNALANLLEVVAKGRIHVLARSVWRFPLSIQIGISDDDWRALEQAGYSLSPWGLPFARMPRWFGSAVGYRPWSA